MKHQTIRTIISVFGIIFLLDSLLFIAKQKLRAFDDAFNIDFDFLEDLDEDCFG